MSTDSEIQVLDNRDAEQWELRDGDRMIGRAEYLTYAEQGVDHVVFFHTEVDDGYSGRGLAKRLVVEALEAAVASGRRVVAVCPYVAAQVGKRPDLATNAVHPAAGHLAAVRSRQGAQNAS